MLYASVLFFWLDGRAKKALRCHSYKLIGIQKNREITLQLLCAHSRSALYPLWSCPVPFWSCFVRPVWSCSTPSTTALWSSSVPTLKLLCTHSAAALYPLRRCSAFTLEAALCPLWSCYSPSLLFHCC